MGVNQGLALITLMKLYDVYQDSYFIKKAIAISEYLSTYMIDLRYGLVSSFYDDDSEFISNYRNFADNLLITWGLDRLIEVMQKSGDYTELAINFQQKRRDYIFRDLDTFVLENQFIGSYRVDDFQSSPIFNVYDNLMAAFIITQTDNFDYMLPVLYKMYDFIKANVSSEKGGIYTIFNKGYHDNLITLKNTALFINVALKLYQLTDNETYLNDAKKSMDYLDYFTDIAKTGGYVEALIDDKPIQQSKSLFSHAILLLAFTNLANLEIEGADLLLLGISKTIFDFFAATGKGYFFSSITKNGEPASESVMGYDNLMILYALTELPILSRVNFNSKVEFSDLAKIDVKLRIPVGITSNVTVSVNDKQVASKLVKGTGNNQIIAFEVTPPRPNSNLLDVPLLIQIDTIGLKTDQISSYFTVVKDTGIILSTEVVTLFSVMLIIVFVLFLKNIGTNYIPRV